MQPQERHQKGGPPPPTPTIARRQSAKRRRSQKMPGARPKSPPPSPTGLSPLAKAGWHGPQAPFTPEQKARSIRKQPNDPCRFRDAWRGRSGLPALSATSIPAPHQNFLSFKSPGPVSSVSRKGATPIGGNKDEKRSGALRQVLPPCGADLIKPMPGQQGRRHPRCTRGPPAHQTPSPRRKNHERSW